MSESSLQQQWLSADISAERYQWSSYDMLKLPREYHIISIIGDLQEKVGHLFVDNCSRGSIPYSSLEINGKKTTKQPKTTTNTKNPLLISHAIYRVSTKSVSPSDGHSICTLNNSLYVFHCKQTRKLKVGENCWYLLYWGWEHQI